MTDWPFDENVSLILSSRGRYARAYATLKRVIQKSKGASAPAKVELIVDRNISDEGPLKANMSKGAGGGNFDCTMWLGNVWLFATDVGAELREMLNTAGSLAPYKIVTDFVKTVDPARNAENRQFIIDLIRNSNLNTCQRKAVQFVLTSRQFALIQGFPGAGKTHTVVPLIHILLKLGKR